MPSDLLTDLTDAFDFYEKHSNLNCISIDHFINILKNFGFHKMDKKSTDAELMKASPDFHKCTGVDFNFVKYVVASRWNRGNGKQEEAIECFKLFNKRNHETITA
jgi:Ca2+-binding EF-hand superfamily protein